jgi:hypothetical protein
MTEIIEIVLLTGTLQFLWYLPSEDFPLKTPHPAARKAIRRQSLHWVTREAHHRRHSDSPPLYRPTTTLPHLRHALELQPIDG